MKQLDYWSLFGMSKKTVITIFVANLVLFSGIAYLGYNMSQPQNDLSDVELGINMYDNQGSTYWLTANGYGNDDGEIITKYKLHELNANMEHSEIIIYQTSQSNQYHSGSIMEVFSDKILIKIEFFNTYYNLIFKIDLNTGESGVALFDLQGLSYLSVFESGMVLLPSASTNGFVDLYSLHLTNISFVDINLPIDGDEIAEPINEYFNTFFYSTADMKRISFPQISTFYDFHLDTEDNLMLFVDGHPEIDIMTTNLDIYDSDNLTTVNNIQLPDIVEDLGFYEFYDDDKDLYLVYSNYTRLDNETIHPERGFWLNQYYILTARDFQSSFNGAVFSIDNDNLSFNLLYSDNIPIRDMTIVGGMYYGITSTVYLFEDEYRTRWYMENNFSEELKYETIILLKTAIQQVLQGDTTMTIHLVIGDDYTKLEDEDWIENGSLLRHNFRKIDNQVVSILFVYQSWRRNNQQIIEAIDYKENLP